jgi:transposase
MTKWLEEGKFRWPAIRDGVMRLSPAQLSALLEGLAWTRVHPDSSGALFKMSVCVASAV